MNKTIDYTPQSNAQLELAYDYILNTKRAVFLTGKAGTGKTTFLHRLKQQTSKRMTIVAPTGVAAINAGGVTLHSLFQLPFTPFVPNYTSIDTKKFSRDKINLIKSIDLLVIDEISMVRCDVLDAVDFVLRQFRNSFLPFGGLQLVLIGDINQLAPVMKDQEWGILKEHYKTVFFFSSHALSKNYPVIIELKHIFRQSDRLFIDLLNQVRNNEMNELSYAMLNQRLNRDVFERNEDQGYITLSSHNAIAKTINRERLEKLSGVSCFYQAVVSGDFSEYNFPTDEHLEFKIGAQVMFIKNDTAREKRYFNGKIGQIVKLESGSISVQTDDHDEILVQVEEWTNIKYSLNLETKTIDEKVLGSFVQMPLKLAYAITIHKSQGLTFDKVIIDAQEAFSSGQVYVALSRCRTFEGIILSTPITSKSIRVDPELCEFNTSIAEQDLGDQVLQKAKQEYRESLILDLLDFEPLHKTLLGLHALLIENSPPIDSTAVHFIDDLLSKAISEKAEVLHNFRRQLMGLIQKTEDAESNSYFKERLSKGANYFKLHCEEHVQRPLNESAIHSDNKKLQASIDQLLTKAKQMVFIKIASFDYCMGDFHTSTFAQIKVNAELDFEKNSQKTYKNNSKELSTSKHPQVYSLLRKLRRALAYDHKVEEYKIFTLGALTNISNTLPTNFSMLEKIKGIGKMTSKRFGVDIIAVVRAYCDENLIPIGDQKQEQPKPKASKGDSHKLSYTLFVEGFAVEQIATQRALAPSTIHSHLRNYVEQGLLRVSEFISASKLEVLEELYKAQPDIKITEAIISLGSDYSYEELRYFVAYRKYKSAQNDHSQKH